MIIGKIGIDLNHLQYSLNAAELEIIPAKKKQEDK